MRAKNRVKLFLFLNAIFFSFFYRLARTLRLARARLSDGSRRFCTLRQRAKLGVARFARIALSDAPSRAFTRLGVAR